MSQPNPIIVDMEVVASNVPVSMQVATQYDLPIDLETLQADHNGDYSAPAGTAWNAAHVAVPGVEVEELSVSENGVYTAPSNKAYSPVTVDVPEEIYFRSATGLERLFFIDSDGIKPNPMPPKEIYINAPNCKIMTSGFAQYVANPTYQNGIEKVTLNIYADKFAPNSLVKRSQTIKELVFTAPVVTLYGAVEFAADATALETITGELNFTLWDRSARSNNFRGATALKDVRISAGCMKYDAVFSSAVLTDDSLVSIANALSDTVTGMTLTHDTTAKARCGQIVGTVTDGVFTIDAGGSTTLTDFITQTKGWTLA